MKDFIQIKEPDIKINGSSTLIPAEVRFKKLRGDNYDAVCQLIYAGLIIDDIYIKEFSNGNISVEFPSKNISNYGAQKRIAILFPCIPELSNQLNWLIIRGYKDFKKNTIVA